MAAAAANNERVLARMKNRGDESEAFSEKRDFADFTAMAAACRYRKSGNMQLVSQSPQLPSPKTHDPTGHQALDYQAGMQPGTHSQRTLNDPFDSKIRLRALNTWTKLEWICPS